MINLHRIHALSLTLPLTLVVSSTGYAATNCIDIVNQLNAKVTALNVVKDQAGSLLTIGKTALNSLKTCPKTPRLWYLALRGAEVIGFPSPEYGDLKHFAKEAARQVPYSVAVVTIQARISDDADTAKQAYTLAPNYSPARRIYALALAKQGKFKQALRLLPSSNASIFDEDKITRARIFLAMHRPLDAEKLARAVIQSPGQYDTTEPTITDTIWREGHEVLGLALLASNQHKDALKALQTAADAGSTAAQAELAKLR